MVGFLPDQRLHTSPGAGIVPWLAGHRNMTQTEEPAPEAPTPVIRRWELPPGKGGKTRIERTLERLEPGWHPHHIGRLLRTGRVLCDGQPAPPGSRPGPGSVIEVLAQAERGARTFLPNRKVRFRVVHADSCVAVVEKPPGLPVHPGPGHGSRTLLGGLLARFPGELEELAGDRGHGLVHRLDLDASGLLVVARSPHAYDSLRRQFEARTVQKRYSTILAGLPAWDEERVERPVHGKDATSVFRVVERLGHATLVEVELITGRKHQIRWHAAALGHPVVGDGRYGPAREDSHPLRRLGTHRLLLHAAELAFAHPATLQTCAFSSRLPRDIWRALRRLREDRLLPVPPVQAGAEESSRDRRRRRSDDDASRP